MSTIIAIGGTRICCMARTCTRFTSRPRAIRMVTLGLRWRGRGARARVWRVRVGRALGGVVGVVDVVVVVG